ncbi:MAG: ATP-dependent Clp protease ATP-binding subunit, partial [Eubacterium sp.]|nr:ATP-dependent Clp protease ATP-binding subunit [Eubacterium sp.]
NRDDEIENVIGILSRRTKNNPCLIGEPGVGKTAIAEGLAARIVDGEVPDVLEDKRILTLDLSGMVAGSKYRGEFEERIKRAIRETKTEGNILLFIDELHTVIGAGGAEGAIDASNILKPALARGEIQVIGATTREEYRKHIEKDAALERRFQPVVIEEPTAVQTISMLKGLRSRYEDFHNVVITDEAIEAAVNLSVRYVNDRFLPDKAIDLVDEAAAKFHLQKIYSKTEKIHQYQNELEDLYEQKEQALVEGNLERIREILAAEEKVEEKRVREVKKRHKKNERMDNRILSSHIAEVVAKWTHIPVQQMQEEEMERLKRLDSILHERVVGQEDAVQAVSRAIRRGRVGLKDPKRPIGSFLFLGPTGVGKTELSKALAEAVFGSEKDMIRVDMSEYMEKQSVSKMIGSPPGYVGYEEGGQLSEKVRQKPYSVLLFDEIEKAHPDVFNMLLQVLEDGHITDAHGRRVDFKNTVIIMTSNAGANRIISPKTLGFGQTTSAEEEYKKMKEGVMEEVKHIFKPEFINRVDEMIVFHTLNKENIHAITEIMVKQFTARVKEQMDIRLEIEEEVVEFVADKGFDKDYGARPIRRALQTEVEDVLAEAVLAGEVSVGDAVEVKLLTQGKKKKVSVCRRDETDAES